MVSFQCFVSLLDSVHLEVSLRFLLFYFCNLQLCVCVSACLCVCVWSFKSWKPWCLCVCVTMCCAVCVCLCDNVLQCVTMCCVCVCVSRVVPWLLRETLVSDPISDSGFSSDTNHHRAVCTVCTAYQHLHCLHIYQHLHSVHKYKHLHCVHIYINIVELLAWKCQTLCKSLKPSFLAVGCQVQCG